MQRGMIKPIINIGFQAIFKLIFAIASLKVVAFYVGPNGMAVVGQIQAFLQILSAGASSVTTTGVVKLIAEDKTPKERALQSSLVLLTAFSFSFFLILLFADDVISNFFLQGEWGRALLLLPLGAFFLGLNNLFVSYFNGCQKYNEYFWFSVITALLTALSTCALAISFGKSGAIYSIALAPVIAGLFVLLLPARFRLPKFNLMVLDIKTIKVLLSYSFMALGSVIVVYGVQIALRDYIAINGSLAEAGVWYAATRLSDIYMGICSVLFSTLLLPKYSSEENSNLTRMVLKVGGVAFGFVLMMVASIILFADFAISLVYGDAFSKAAGVMKVYVVGDGLKCLSWVFLYIMIAKQHVKFYIAYEVFSALLYLAFCVMFFRFYGFQNMAFGYVLQGGISLFVVLIWFFAGKYKTSQSDKKDRYDPV
ncbi:Membrane protein involved in the export of O-antigen and teichoic acid [Pseudomonas koreensis]|nr:oligosaccharide flippase family protein [Pseudomonas koreensis]NNA60661.1 oligosaccharide flippase family protein [Pseudomonas koreensis]SDE06157.1 Membrane protein involved in the export of O-antigen and teichoic acid [Pseudomonas koreensis]